MEMESVNIEKASIFLSGLKAKIAGIAMQTKKVAMDDPRRLIHSLKAGLALTLVSLFYYFQPLYTSFGVSTMWAVMTVVVVFEFSVGATLGKGLNRGLATLAAGALGLGANHLASVSGKTWEPVLIGLFVFLQAVASTFIRFFPTVKARYDYGMLIFILTFSLISISGLRSDQILELAHKRLSTVLIGASTCVIISIFVYPVWAGEDLHKLVAQNLEKLGGFLEGFGDEYLRTFDQESENERTSSLVGLNSVLDSKSKEETLANFARWEPGHGQFMYRHPWKQYLKIANLTRQCAGRVEALNAYLNSKTPASQEIQCMIAGISTGSGEVLKELSWAITTMSRPPSPSPHIPNLKTASKNLNSLLKSDFCEENTNLLQVIPVATVAALLNDTVTSVENIADAVNELSSLANFKPKDSSEAEAESANRSKIPHVVITVDGAAEVKKEGQSSVQAVSN
ncbi:UNVERIFIED_CONTAM: Aluminum-activated malate transporter 7 [Sesamum angustifolium]|uniref:Aluminum-activated malate transporter 7 n=1 Tax=Sesamum angustifolium TaxID=2727405 RepID=A0AAW2QRB4_9LAMI